MTNAQLATLGPSILPSFIRDQSSHNSATRASLAVDTRSEIVGDNRQGARGTFANLAVGYMHQLIKPAPHHSILDRMVLPVNVTSIEINKTVDVPIRILEDQQAAQCISDIQHLSGLNTTDVAEKLVGVSRQSLHSWKSGGAISDEHVRKLLGIKALLEQAKSHQLEERAASGLRWWLYEPRGEAAVAPIDLIRQGDLARARLFAMATAPASRSMTANWLESGAEDQETVRISRILDSYSEQDYDPEPDGAGGGA